MSTVDVLGFDPGKNNFAYSHLVDGKCVEYGFLPELGSLNQEDWTNNYKTFLLNFRSFLGRFPTVQTIAIERYLPRPGMDVGSVSEPINLMIGMITAVSHVPVEVFLPSTWKLYMGRVHNIGKSKMKVMLHEDMRGYFLARNPNLRSAAFIGQEVKKVLKKHQISTHECDAIGIAVFHVERNYGKSILEGVL